jgi:glycosyltransferase domain-containing protein
MVKTLVNITFGPGNRKSTLNGILNYYDKFSDDELPFIVITDQSNSTWDKIEHRAIKAFHHYPVSQYSMYDMWVDLISKYNPKYFCWNNDDDFTVPSSIKMAETFLDSNPDYTCVQGQVAASVKNTVNIYPYAQSTWFQKDSNNEDVVKRLKQTFTNLHANPHAIFTSDTFKNACMLCLESFEDGNNFGCLRFWDKVLCFVSAVDGKRKTNLDCLMSVRSDRLITEQVAHIADEYHPILEKSTNYSAIYKRLGTPQNKVKSYFYKKTNTKISSEFLISLFNEKNIGFSSSSKTSTLPSNTLIGKSILKHATESWLKI